MKDFKLNSFGFGVEISKIGPIIRKTREVPSSQRWASSIYKMSCKIDFNLIRTKLI